MKYKQIFIFIGFVLIQGCDCVQNANGVVLDASTNMPLDSVFVYKINNKSVSVYTDDSGAFTLTAISGGLFKCPPMNIMLERKNYNNKAVVVESDKNNVYYLNKNLR